MKITFVLPGYCLRPVGGARVVYEYANQLVKRGHQVFVIHPRIMRNRRHWLFSWVYKIFKRTKLTWQKIDPQVKMLYVVEPTKRYLPDADIVLATAWQTAEYVEALPESKGQKFYLIQHYEAWEGDSDRLDATWRSSLKKIVISKWLYRKGLELGLSASTMKHIPNGIDHDKFKLINPLEKRSIDVAMMYHRAEWKGSLDGLKALQTVRQSLPELKVVVFGRDPKPTDFPAWIKYVCDPKQSYLVNDIYNQAKIFLSPSWTEGWPLPPAEAMACGCALVSTNCTGIDEYTEDQKTVLLSPIKNPSKLAANIIKFLQDDKMRLKFALAGNRAIKEFTWQRSTDQLEEYLRNAA